MACEWSDASRYRSPKTAPGRCVVPVNVQSFLITVLSFNASQLSLCSPEVAQIVVHIHLCMPCQAANGTFQQEQEVKRVHSAS